MLPAFSTSIQRASPKGSGGKALADMSVAADHVLVVVVRDGAHCAPCV
jgi:hypothetical protein